MVQSRHNLPQKMCFPSSWSLLQLNSSPTQCKFPVTTSGKSQVLTAQICLDQSPQSFIMQNIHIYYFQVYILKQTDLKKATKQTTNQGNYLKLFPAFPSSSRPFESVLLAWYLWRKVKELPHHCCFLYCFTDTLKPA